MRQSNSATGSFGAAHTHPSDAYKDVPILKQPTWNHEVAAYFYLGGISAGAAVLGSIADMLGGERRRTLARTAHYVSFATLLVCPPLLIADLGKPARFHHMLRIFKPSSPMNLGSWALLSHGAGATVTVLTMLARDGRLPVLGPLFRALPERLLAALGLPSSLMLAGYTGVLLGTTSIPVWFTSPLLGALFMSSALGTGWAAVNVASAVAPGQEPEAALASLGVLFGSTEIAVLAGYVATSRLAGKPLMSGQVAPLLAAYTPLRLTSIILDLAAHRAKSKHWRLASSVLALSAGALLRWAIIRAGHVSAADREGALQATQASDQAPGWLPPA